MRQYKLMAYVLVGLAFPFWIILARYFKPQKEDDKTIEKTLATIAEQNSITQNMLTKLLTHGRESTHVLVDHTPQYVEQKITGFPNEITMKLPIIATPP